MAPVDPSYPARPADFIRRLRRRNQLRTPVRELRLITAAMTPPTPIESGHVLHSITVLSTRPAGLFSVGATPPVAEYFVWFKGEYDVTTLTVGAVVAHPARRPDVEIRLPLACGARMVITRPGTHSTLIS